MQHIALYPSKEEDQNLAVRWFKVNQLEVFQYILNGNPDHVMHL